MGIKSTIRVLCILASVAAVAGAVSACSGSASSGGTSSASTHISVLQEIQQSGELKVGLAAYSTQIIQNPKTGAWSGIQVDPLEAWAKLLGVKFVPVATSWTNIVAGLQAGDYEIATGLNTTSQRAVSIDFSIPDAEDTGIFAIDTKKVGDPTWAQLDVPSHTVCGIVGGAFTLALANDSFLKMKLLTLPSEQDCQLAIESGRAQAYMDSWYGQPLWAKSDPDIKLLFSPTPVAVLPGAYGLPAWATTHDLQAFNTFLTNYIDDGQYTATEQKYGGVADPFDYTIGPWPTWATQEAQGIFTVP